MNKDFYFNFSVSVNQYDRNKDNAAFLQWREINGNITTLSDYISEGYAYCNCFYHKEGTTFGNGLKKENNAKSANLICLDLDAVKLSYNDFVATMELSEIKPNIVYTTANNGHFKPNKDEEFNNRYRAIYVIDEPIYNNALYKEVHQALKNEIRIITADDNIFNDNTDNNISHFFAGCKGASITTDNNIYPLTWLMERYGISADNGKSATRNNNKGDESANQFNNKGDNTSKNNGKHTYITDLYNKKLNDLKSDNHSNIGKEEKESIINMDGTFTEKEKQFINDFYCMPFHELIHKYISIFPSIECTQLEYDDTEEIITLPSDYAEIKRRWYLEEFEMSTGDIIKWSNVHKTRNGEGRRNLLFKNLLIRKRILPSITFCHLLLNAVYEINYFINNTDVNDKITKQQIAQIAVNAYFAEDRMKNYEEKRKYKVNEKYCIKHGISKRALNMKTINKIEIDEKNNNLEKVKLLYNPNLTDAQNLSILNEKGVNISLRTFKRYKKELGLIKTPNKRPTSDKNTKDNKDITTAETSAERAQETPQKEESIKAQETANKSVLSVENASVEEIPNKEGISAERAQETQITYNNKYPHLAYINEMINFENMMENANTIQEIENLKNEFEMKLKGFPNVPKSAEKVVNSSLKSTMAKYEKILESLKN